MRFLGALASSVAAAALIAVLVLGRDQPPPTYQLTAIADAFEDRYAAALAALEDGGILYLRSEQRSGDDGSGGFTSLRIFETWVGTNPDGVPIARTEESDATGTVLRITEIEGATRTLAIDATAGTEDREPTTVEFVQRPTALLASLRDRTIATPAPGALAVGTAPIGDHEAARLAAGPPPASGDVVFAIDDPLIHIQRHYPLGAARDTTLHPLSELALLEWAVLPAGTPLSERP